MRIATAILAIVSLGIAAVPPASAEVTVTLQVVAEGLTAPLALVSSPDDTKRRFIVEQIGVIRVLTADGKLLDEPFLNIRHRIPKLHQDFDERGLLGLAFKAGTNDLRDSPALKIAKMLKAEGAELVAYDPAIPAEVDGVTDGVTDDVTVVDDVQHAAKGANALVVLTEWPQFRSLDWAALAGAMTGQVVVDTRNLLDVDVLTRAGLTSHGVGR